MHRIYNQSRSNVISQNGMAATSQPLSTIEAISILKKGGNAIDAAIAASAVQAVVEPGSTGIGGDCFAIISLNGKKPISVNGSGISPSNLNYEYLIKNKIESIGLTSPHSVTIPGSIDAWHTMHEKYGKLDFEELFLSAQKYAKNGFLVNEKVSIDWNKNIQKLKEYKSTSNLFLKNKNAYNFGDIFKNMPLAKTLKHIARLGAKGFYSGYVAEDMVKSLNDAGGVHTLEDFNNQKTIFSETIEDNYKKYLIHQCPPNGPGITVLMMLKLFEKFNFKNVKPDSFERFHLQAEIAKICFEEKEVKLGDINYSKSDLNKFISNDSIDKLYKKINLNNIYDPSKSYVTSHPDTVYLTVVDRDLNCVSFINSLCHAFGSAITSNKTGILFQNRGVNFRVEKNHINKIEGNKRPLHTIIPGLLTDKNYKSFFSFGVMGGQYQPIGQTHVLQNIFDFDMNLQEAIDFSRAFMINGELKLEKSILYSTYEKLKNIGHNVNYVENSIGGGQGILIDRSKGILIGGSDKRKDGFALGY